MRSRRAAFLGGSPVFAFRLYWSRGHGFAPFSRGAGGRPCTNGIRSSSAMLAYDRMPTDIRRGRGLLVISAGLVDVAGAKGVGIAIRAEVP
jgi:hypothetical protein